MSWQDSHDLFHSTFSSFPWEVLEVFTGPPVVAFSWRHWGHFTGEYKGNKGKGELIEVFGWGVATVNENLQLCETKIYYDAEKFLEVMERKLPPSATSGVFNAFSKMKHKIDMTGDPSLCPFLGK